MQIYLFFPVSPCVGFCFPSQLPTRQYTGSSQPLNVQLVLLRAGYELWSSLEGWQELWKEGDTGGNKHQQQQQDLNQCFWSRESEFCASVLFPIHWGQDGASHGHTARSSISLHNSTALPSQQGLLGGSMDFMGRDVTAAGHGGDPVFWLWISPWAVASILPGV